MHAICMYCRLILIKADTSPLPIYTLCLLYLYTLHNTQSPQ